MKNRITTPDGARINLDKVTQWYPYEYQYEYKVAIEFGTTTTFFSFGDSKEERDAFLARLDNYFQEIA